MVTASYSVPGIMCEGCANAIKRALSALDGLQHVDVDITAKRVAVVHGENVRPSEIVERIVSAGYDVQQA